jgi:hypothetical protein
MRAKWMTAGLGLWLTVACGGEVGEALEAAEVGQSEAPLYMAHPGLGVREEYLVVLRPEATVDPREVASQAGVATRYVYRSALRGFAGRLSPSQLRSVRRDGRVAYVEQSQLVRAETFLPAPKAKGTQLGAPWYLDRIDQRPLPMDGAYTFLNQASTVYAYVISTGLQSNHPEFGMRASNPYDGLGGNGEDCNGLGTFVAGLIGAETYGVAKDVRLRGVRVLNCNGTGNTATIIAGFDWVSANAERPAVAHTTISSLSTALNTAAQNLADSGIALSATAGSSNIQACNVSPASAPGVLAVAIADSQDQRLGTSNYGSCVDLYAPGGTVTSTWTGSSTRTLSGTTISASLVAGVAALYKGTYGEAPTATVNDWITSTATPNVVSSNPVGTPNLLLYTGGL